MIGETGYSHINSLSGHKVIVTGAARGIGRGIALALAERGATVQLIGRRDNVVQVADEINRAGYLAHYLVADLENPDCPGEIVTSAVTAMGGVTALINNAMDGNDPRPLMEITTADLDLAFDIGPRATLALMQAVYPEFVRAGGGSIVNFGSGAGTAGMAGYGSYAAAKEAIRGISKVAALEWAKDNVRTNVICPFADSEGLQQWRARAFTDYQQVIGAIPLGRPGDPQRDIGAVVSFLISDDAAYLTGLTINVDGGAGSFR